MIDKHGTVWRGHGSFSLDKVLSTGRVKAPRLNDLPLTGEIHATAHINTLDEGDGGMVCFTPSQAFAYLYALKECNADPVTIAAAFDRTFPNEPDLGNLRNFFLERNFMAPESRAAISEALRLNRWRIKKAEKITPISTRLRTLRLRESLLIRLLQKVDEDSQVAEQLRAIRSQYPALLAFGDLSNLYRVQLRLLPGHKPDLELGHTGDIAIGPHLKEVHVPHEEIDAVRSRINACGLEGVKIEPLTQFAA